MARKKKEESSGGNAPWLATFADLMNLLLCFFVLLFSMSSVDAEKFEQIAASMANSIGVLDGGNTSIGEGQLISSGMSQLSELSEFFTTMGTSSDQSESNIENEGKNDPEDPINTEDSQEGTNGEEGENDTQSSEVMEGIEGTQGSGEAQDSEAGVGIDEAKEKIKEEMEEVTSSMYDEVSDLADQFNLDDYIELSMDSEFHYVMLTLKGSILYESGEADIKEIAEPILTKVGEILKKFDKYGVEITGHTDNVPMTSSTYKDNNWLSSARALNAAEFLIQNSDINPDRLKYSGRGEYEPVSSNATSEGRANNRRIEIKIHNEYSGW